MKEYNHLKIEKKWQKEWDKKKAFQAKNTGKKYYSLMEFPYPSGDGLHVGHVRGFAAMDIISRKRRMEGFNVLFPIGWDAFGLPTENYAIKTGIQPAKVTKTNTDNFRKQFKGLGMSFDWSREINTTDPKYYKWTQWIFLQMFKEGLAYKKKMFINWCPKDKIGLANEEVIDGKCERCGTVVEKREKEQWMLAITKYADRLDKDLDDVDYLPQIKTQQRNWIGRSEGAEIEFEVNFTTPSVVKQEKIKVFTTRPDTLFGVTYVVLAPENELVEKLKSLIKNWNEVEQYINEAKKKNHIDRTNAEKEKTGVRLGGVTAINPVNNEEVPIFIADYVLADYGTGAVMAVPAHDVRDFAFAKKYKLPIKQVIMPDNLDIDNPPRDGKKDTERNTVHVILRDIKNKAVLVEFLDGEKWGNKKPRNFVIGGIEDGETEMEAAIRELKEETGYTNFKFVEQVPIEIQARFFAAHKDVNRKIRVRTLVFDLIGNEKVEITEDEFFTKDSHKTQWVSYEKVSETVNIVDDIMSWKYFYSGGFAYEGNGILINSRKFDGKNSEEIKKEITEFAGGKWVETFKLRDWIFSRQRYWGEPIPVVNCPTCGLVPLPEKDLPLVLPKVKNYQPTDNGESPLANITKWVNTKCPNCKGPAKRETDTMPNWAGSSWYYLAYTSQGISNFQFPISNENSVKSKNTRKNIDYWTPVDWYNGGMEHTTLHVLYSRFWHKFLFDIGVVPTHEPYKKRTAHGMILAEGGEKMSKSRGNVINPDTIVKTFGADTLRVYEMFMGPFDQAIAWDTNSISGSRRFIERVWRLQNKVAGGTLANKKLETLVHKTIQKVSDDIEAMHFNTAISSMMILVNEFEKSEGISREQYEKLILLLSPFAPHISEEIWQVLGNKKPLFSQKWPKVDPKKMQESEVKTVIQINGKVRSQIITETGLSQDEVVSRVQKMSDVDKWLSGKKIVKIIYIPGRILNFVVTDL